MYILAILRELNGHPAWVWREVFNSPEFKKELERERACVTSML